MPKSIFDSHPNPEREMQKRILRAQERAALRPELHRSESGVLDRAGRRRDRHLACTGLQGNQSRQD